MGILDKFLVKKTLPTIVEVRGMCTECKNTPEYKLTLCETCYAELFEEGKNESEN